MQENLYEKDGKPRVILTKFSNLDKELIIMTKEIYNLSIPQILKVLDPMLGKEDIKTVINIDSRCGCAFRDLISLSAVWPKVKGSGLKKAAKDAQKRLIAIETRDMKFHCHNHNGVHTVNVSPANLAKQLDGKNNEILMTCIMPGQDGNEIKFIEAVKPKYLFIMFQAHHSAQRIGDKNALVFDVMNGDVVMLLEIMRSVVKHKGMDDITLGGVKYKLEAFAEHQSNISCPSGVVHKGFYILAGMTRVKDM